MESQKNVVMIRTQQLGINLFFFGLLYLSTFSSKAQSYTIHSNFMKKDRIYSVKLPENYDPEKKYSTIYVLDGALIGSVVGGVSDYYSEIEKATSSIVISINQKGTRWEDCSYDTNGDLNGSGQSFFNFVTKELIPTIDSSYKTNEFRVIVGHSFTANYVNYFFLETEVFTGFIAISPYYAKNVIKRIKAKAEQLSDEKFYYVSYAENDLSGHIKSVKKADKIFQQIDNPKFVYKKDYINDKTHLTLVPQSYDNAALWVNQYYALMSTHYDKKILKKEKENFTRYFFQYYKRIERLYDQKLDYRFEDVEFMSLVISQYGTKSELKSFGELSIKLFPESYVGYYCLGEYYEKTKKLKKSLESYKIGYDKLGEECLNKDQFYESIEKVEKKLN